MKRLVITIYILTGFILFGTSCANIISPSGGVRDSIPPVLLRSVPADSTLHFSGNKITLYFNEFVRVDNPSQNVIVSPIGKQIPLIENKLYTVTVKLKDTLEPNTTYNINFGSAIKDINEGNVAQQFTYIFSTGNYIDSGRYAGNVVMAESGKIDTTLIVVLHKNLSDTAIAKLSPRYYAKLNGSGRFVFHNLPTDTFAIYAIPNDYSRKYDDSTKIFAFADAPVIVGQTTDSLTLYAYQEAKEQPKRSTVNVTKKAKDKKDEVTYIKITLVSGNTQDLLSDMEFTLSSKLKNFDSSKFTLYDTSYVPISKLSLTIDSTLTKLTTNYKWPENTSFNLVIEKDAVTDSSGVTLSKNDTIHFSTKKESDYGSLRLRFADMNPDKHYVLQLYQNDRLFQSIPVAEKVWHTKLFHPGEYELRILDDSNNNGIWDPGHFFGEKKQPERVIFLPRKLTVRANWDNEADISVKK